MIQVFFFYKLGIFLQLYCYKEFGTLKKLLKTIAFCSSENLIYQIENEIVNDNDISDNCFLIPRSPPTFDEGKGNIFPLNQNDLNKN